MARTIRVSNNRHIAGAPYQLLKGLSFVEYSEGFPAENARRLHENEVDLAIIPVFDYAAHGGYGALDFGMGCRQRSGSMVLYALKDIHRLKAIHLYEDSRSSLLMLEILLREYWHSRPDFIRHRRGDLFVHLREDEGILALHDHPGSLREDLPVCHDLATAWYEHTGLPSVFLVWAARHGVLDRKQLAAINRCLHVGERHKKTLAVQSAESYGSAVDAAAEFVGENRRFYLDEFLLQGLEDLLDRGARHRLHPKTSVARFTHCLADSAPKIQRKDLKVEDIIAQVEQGGQLSITAALKLIEKAPHALLQGAVEHTRKEAKEVLSQELILTITRAQASSILQRGISGLKSHAHQIIYLACEQRDIDPRETVQLLRQLSRQLKRPTLAPGVECMNRYSGSQDRAPSVVIAELLSEGLFSIAPSGGGMLIDQKLSQEGMGFRQAEWFEIVRTLHAHGRPSWCSVRLSEQDSWEERLVHLEKLRSLQHETPGYQYCFVEPGEGALRISSSEMDRVLYVVRLFLHNISWSYQQPSWYCSPFIPASSEASEANRQAEAVLC